MRQIKQCVDGITSLTVQHIQAREGGRIGGWGNSSLQDELRDTGTDWGRGQISICQPVEILLRRMFHAERRAAARFSYF